MDKLLLKYGTSRNGHSLFAPSGSAGWLNCAGSLLVNARATDSAGIDAAEGTVAHGVAELWNKTGERPSHLVGTTDRATAGGNEYEITITDLMLYHVERFVDWCREVPGDHYYEQRVDLSALMPIPGQGGTADHFACQPGILTITDLKYGTGVRVYAERNTQALLYASGVFMEWDWIYGFKIINIRICQPRLDVFEVWSITRQELLEFMAFATVKAREAWVENAPRTPSPKACEWCAGFERCPARLALIDQLIDNTSEFDQDLDEDAEVTSITYHSEVLENHTKLVKAASKAVARLEDGVDPELSTAALAYAYGFRRTMEKWFKAIGEKLLDKAEKGEHVPYFTLSEGRKSRKFKDVATASGKLVTIGLPLDKVAPRKMATIKDVEKLLIAQGVKPKEREEILKPLINVVQSKRSLVPVNDDRPDDDELTDDFDEGEDE